MSVVYVTGVVVGLFAGGILGVCVGALCATERLEARLEETAEAYRGTVRENVQLRARQQRMQ